MGGTAVGHAGLAPSDLGLVRHGWADLKVGHAVPVYTPCMVMLKTDVIIYPGATKRKYIQVPSVNKQSNTWILYKLNILNIGLAIQNFTTENNT